MSWWATLTTIFIWVAFSLFEFANYKKSVADLTFNGDFLSFYLQHWHTPFGVSLFVFLGCSWIFIPWRRQLPIIFNRKTRTVSFIDGDTVYSEDWAKIEVYIKDVTTATAGGGLINEGILTLVFQQRRFDGRQLRAVILGTQDVPAAMANRGIYGAAMVWEYIRLYMNEGAVAIPPIAPIIEYRLKYPSDSFRQFNPIKALKVKFWWYPVAVPFFLFVALPLAPIAIVGDLLYYALDLILPRRKWPQAFIDVCDGVWNGREG